MRTKKVAILTKAEAEAEDSKSLTAIVVDSPGPFFEQSCATRQGKRLVRSVLYSFGCTVVQCEMNLLSFQNNDKLKEDLKN